VEVTEFLGRGNSQRHQEDAIAGYGNGYGRRKRIAVTAGTITGAAADEEFGRALREPGAAVVADRLIGATS
jgi:hypothetical protein